MVWDRWSIARGAAVAATLALIVPAFAAGAGATADGPHAALIQTGTCTAPGDVLASLSDVSPDFLVDASPPAGDAAASPAAASPLEASLTTVAVPLGDLVAGAASIVIHAADGTPLVCGDIGERTLGSDLPVALVPADDSGYHGIAVLRDLGDGRTSVALYLSADAAGGPSARPTGSQTVQVGSSVYFSGFDVTVEEATHDAVAGTLEIAATFQNLGTGTANLTALQLNGHPTVLQGTDTIPLRVASLAVPPGATTRATLTSGNLPADFSLDGATLQLGQADQHQATVELSPGGIAVSEAPVAIRLPKKARSATIKGTAHFSITKAQLVPAACTGSRDAVVFTPSPASELSLVLTVTAQGRARLGALIGTFATAPDGTSGVGGPGVLSIGLHETARDVLYCYTVPAPGPGRYTVRFEAGGRHATIGFRVPAPP